MSADAAGLRALRQVGRQAAARTLSLVRRGRQVAWVPEWMNLGNLLYMGQWAHEGADRAVLLHPRQEQAVGIFPHLRRSLFLTRSQVRFRDQRVMPWGSATERNAAFRDAQNDDEYIREMLLPASGLESPRVARSEDLVVNVRRGDYYSVEQHFREFAIDQETYLRAALDTAVQRGGSPRRLLVISDDVAWCREHLDALLHRYAPVKYSDGDMKHDLRALVQAERLVIPNSTFSYWGAYIGDVLHPGRDVTAPWLFSRSVGDGRAYQLRPHWHMIREGCSLPEAQAAEMRRHTRGATSHDPGGPSQGADHG